MLEELEIKNLGPIEQAHVQFSSGMIAITGETGAGKSMLLNAMRLILGMNYSSSSQTDKEIWVQGIFSAQNQPIISELIQNAGIENDEDDELFLTRTISASSGRSRAVINGKSAPRSLMQDVAQHLVTIHGQADQLRIASATKQREFLDSIADNAQIRQEYTQVWERLQHLADTIDNLENNQAQTRERIVYLRESVERIASVDPHPQEDEQLKAKRSRIENAANIVQAVSVAAGSLDSSTTDSDMPGVVQLLNNAIDALSVRGVSDTFASSVERLESAREEISDVAFNLRVDDEDLDVNALDDINSRLHDLQELTKRFGTTIQDVLDWKEKAEFEIEDLDYSPEKIAKLQHEYDETLQHAYQLAQSLHESREVAAQEISSTVNAELANLAMPDASFSIHVQERQHDNSIQALDRFGVDNIEFMFTPFPNSGAMPMGKSASGGELSRLMLALELAAAAKNSKQNNTTFIFDEVDAGVGGKAAVELGARLAKLAQQSQVIVVTHLPQVAAFANTQLVVQKQSHNNTIQTKVHQLNEQERVHEIARMLDGSESQTSLKHAQQLLTESSLT
ncbi:MAG: DNA repair protein RecN [Bifidobacteriaceae bacterium]|nr:DNA repair protein RecN [Bifidobacteriaceae bacterium]